MFNFKKKKFRNQNRELIGFELFFILEQKPWVADSKIEFVIFKNILFSTIYSPRPNWMQRKLWNEKKIDNVVIMLNEFMLFLVFLETSTYL